MNIRTRVYQIIWMFKFRHRFCRPCKKPAVALMVNGMEKGGLEQIVIDLYHGYKKHGYRVYIVCNEWTIDSIKNKLDAVEDVFIHGGDFNALAGFLWRRDIRNLHYHFNVFGLRAFHAMGFRTLYTMHNLYTFMNDSQIMERAKKLKSADWFVPVAPFVEDYFCRRTHYRKKNVKVILDGINIDDLDDKSIVLPVSRASLGCKENDIVLGMVASFYHVKHQIGMIGVMEQLLKRYSDVKLVILGAYGDADYHYQFMERLDISPAKNNIIICPFLDHQCMGAFYRQIVDIFVLPSMREGFGLVSVEAMYCGKPLVLTPTGAGETFISQGAGVLADCPYSNLQDLDDDEVMRLSVLKDAPNRDSLVSAISLIIDRLPEFQMKAEQCNKNALLYSVDCMVKEYVKLLR